MKKGTLLTNNLIPIFVALIAAGASIFVSYLQIQANKSVNAMDSEKVRAISMEQIDLKLAPIDVKLDALLTDLEEYKHNQEKITDSLREWMKSISARQSAASISSADKSDEIMSYQLKNKKLFIKKIK